MNLRRTTVVLCLAATMTLSVSGAASAAAPTLRFTVFAQTGHFVADVLWTGTDFLYVENTANVIWSAPPAGMPLTQVAAMPRLVEETRCVLSPGTHGFPAGDLYCASPDDKIYDIRGSTVRVLAQLPVTSTSDGALAFDDVGRFGFRLVAATGRSGAGRPNGGRVYTIGPSGAVRYVGAYPGPAGADEVLVLPKGFGAAAGDAVLAVDGGPGAGALIAIDPHGRLRTIAKLRTGPNPLVIVPRLGGSSAATPGLYVADDVTKDVYFAPASQFRTDAGALLVGSEVGGRFWLFRPRGRGYAVAALRSNLGGDDDLEGAVFVR